MDKIHEVTKNYIKPDIPDFNSGDTVAVDVKVREGNKERVQRFEGLVIARHRKNGLDGTFTVRKITNGIGVERIFPVQSPLIESINVLPEKSAYPNNELGRASKGAAKTLLAKINMYQNKWQSVFDLTNEVIISREYSLTPKYEDIWKEIGENNQESIFEIQAKGELPSVGVDKYSLTQGARGQGGWGWGFNIPSENLLNSYNSNDLRKDATIIFRGETLFDGRFVPQTVVNPMYNQKAYSSAFTENEQNGKNIRILRSKKISVCGNQ